MAQETASVLIKRALARQCPVCGLGDVFASHFRMNRNCPNCHVIFWADPGESLGAMYVDYIVATIVFVAAWAALAWLTPLSDMMQLIVIAILSVAAVLICYPVSRSVWTVLVYLSGGIERPRFRLMRGGRT